MARATPSRPDEFGPRALAGLSRLTAERLAKAGVDPEPLLREVGLSRALIAPGARIDIRRQTAFVNLAAEALNDAFFGFHIARDGDLRELEFLYYVMASAPTLGQALAREERYSSMVNEGIRTSCKYSDEVAIEVEYLGVERQIARHELEFWLACTVRKCRQFTSREVVPTHVGFAHECGHDASEMERYFGRTIEFRAMRDRLCFEREVAELPQVTADPHLDRLLVKDVDEASAGLARPPQRLRVRVENGIAARLPHGTARMSSVAKDLGMSTRTLSRRLAAEGESFGAILDKLRSDLATRYLTRSDLSLSQIGWLLGYVESSSFVRAVQRWTGKSPGEVRRTSAQVDSTTSNSERQ